MALASLRPTMVWTSVVAVFIAMSITGISQEARLSISILIISAIMLAILFYITKIHDGFQDLIGMINDDWLQNHEDPRGTKETQESIYQYQMTSLWVLQPVDENPENPGISSGFGIDPSSTETST